jgi:hypothetical protein
MSKAATSAVTARVVQSDLGAGAALEPVPDEGALQVAVWSANNPYFDEKRLERRLLLVGEHRINIRQAWKPDGKGGTEIGYGAVVYPSAVVLADELREVALDGKRVVELGAGHGFVSIAAAVLGAAQVVCTDGDEGSCSLAAVNVADNSVEGTVEVSRMLWGDEEMQRAVRPSMSWWRPTWQRWCTKRPLRASSNASSR